MRIKLKTMVRLLCHVSRGPPAGTVPDVYQPMWFRRVQLATSLHDVITLLHLAASTCCHRQQPAAALAALTAMARQVSAADLQACRAGAPDWPSAPRSLLLLARHLLQLLGSRRSSVAAGVLVVLHAAVQGPRLQLLLLAAGLVPRLVSLLRRTSKPSLLGPSLQLLGMLAASPAPQLECAQQAGVVQCLLRLMQPAHPASATRHIVVHHATATSTAAITLLSHLCALPSIKLHVRRWDGIACLCTALLTLDTTALGGATGLVGPAMSHVRSRSPSRPGAVRPEQLPLQRLLATLVSLTFDSAEDQWAVATRQGVLLLLVRCLTSLVPLHDGIVHHATWLIAHCAQPANLKPHIGGCPGLLAALLDQLHCTAPAVACAALMALVNLTAPGSGLASNGPAVASQLDWLQLAALLQPQQRGLQAALPKGHACRVSTTPQHQQHQHWGRPCTQGYAVWLLLNLSALPQQLLLTFGMAGGGLASCVAALAALLTTGALSLRTDDGNTPAELAVRAVAALGGIVTLWPGGAQHFADAGGMPALAELLLCPTMPGHPCSAVVSNTALCLSLLAGYSDNAAHAALEAGVLPALSSLLACEQPAVVAHAAAALVPLARPVLEGLASSGSPSEELPPMHRRLLVQLLQLLMTTSVPEVLSATQQALQSIIEAHAAATGGPGCRTRAGGGGGKGGDASSMLLEAIQVASVELLRSNRVSITVTPI